MGFIVMYWLHLNLLRCGVVAKNLQKVDTPLNKIDPWTLSQRPLKTIEAIGKLRHYSLSRPGSLGMKWCVQRLVQTTGTLQPGLAFLRTQRCFDPEKMPWIHFGQMWKETPQSREKAMTYFRFAGPFLPFTLRHKEQKGSLLFFSKTTKNWQQLEENRSIFGSHFFSWR